MSGFEFTLNRQKVRVADIDPNTTLLDYLQHHRHTGTKEGCAEGECGACAVVMRQQGKFVAFNSCLTLLPSIADQDIYTVEGLETEHLHPVQQKMVDHAGSQCGFCTPGFVMSMFAEYYRDKEQFDVEAISGNLCRCTGYRPIRDAARDLANPAPEDEFKQQLAAPSPALERLEYRAAGKQLLRPSNLEEFFLMYTLNPEAVLLAGGTDVVVEVNQRHLRPNTVISLEGLAELKIVSHTEAYTEVGAGVPLSELETHLGHIPAFADLFHVFASRLIRNRATLGGSLATASPIGDSAPLLLAADAEVVLARQGVERTLALSEFFLGYRQTALLEGEIIKAVRIPRAWGHLHFYKIAKRPQDDISSVALGIQISVQEGNIHQVRIGLGGVAATPVRAVKTEELLLGQPWSLETAQQAGELLQEEFSPISDHRASGAYRKAMLGQLVHRFYTEVNVN